MPLEPFLIFAWGIRSSTFSHGATKPFPNRFRQFFRKTIWREQYLAHPAFGRFPQSLLLLFQQFQLAPVFFEFEQFFLQCGDMAVRAF